MTCAYLIYTNDMYRELSEVLVNSLLEFSMYDIEITTTGFDFSIKHSRIKNIRQDGVGKDFSDICYFKNLKMAATTNYDVGVILDADMVANTNVDELMIFACEHRTQYPLCAGHGKDPENQAEAMRRLGVVNKPMPYVYSSYVFSKESKQFLGECWDLSQKWKREEFIPPNTGEAILNCYLWKIGAKEQMNCWLPYIDVLPHYLSHGQTANPLEGYYTGKGLSYHVWHGQKNTEKAKDIFNQLKTQDKNNPLLSIKPLTIQY